MRAERSCKTSGASRRGNAKLCRYPPNRHRPRRRTIQYSRDIGDRNEEPRRTGSPARAGYDDSCVIARSDPSAGAQRATASAEARRAKAEGGSDEAIHSFFALRDGLLRGACHRARIPATRWLAITHGELGTLRYCPCLSMSSSFRPQSCHNCRAASSTARPPSVECQNRSRPSSE